MFVGSLVALQDLFFGEFAFGLILLESFQGRGEDGSPVKDEIVVFGDIYHAILARFGELLIGFGPVFVHC